MKNFKYVINLIFLGFLLSSCAQEVIDKYEPVETVTPTPITPSAGEANFSKYIAVGNSLTAGYMNGALYTQGQNNSLAAQLAKQFALVGGGQFNQPDINSEHGFFGMAGNVVLGRLRLSAATGRPAPIIPGQLIAPYEGDKSALNNFGVPGTTLGLALTPFAGGPYDPENPQANPAYLPHYARFASDPGSSTIIGDAAAALANGGTFFTFWLGSMDVLGYAFGGASNPNILTSVEDFQTRYQIALGALLQAAPEAKGMVANIPDIIDLPYFRTIAYNAVPLNQAFADQLNDGYAQFNGGINLYNAGMLPGQTAPPSAEMQRPLINFVEGQNSVVIEDETLPDLTAYGIPSIRQATPGDLITLSAGSIIGTAPNPEEPTNVIGITIPLGDAFALIPQEQQEIQDRVNAFNAIISDNATTNSARIGLVNINSIFKQFSQTGFAGDNIFIISALAPPFGAFSLDGIHPNLRGYSYTANQFILAINQKFNATIPLINLTTTQGNELPQ